MLGLVASSSNGSPGASASTTNSTIEMPIRLGMAISNRRRRYWPKSCPMIDARVGLRPSCGIGPARGVPPMPVQGGGRRPRRGRHPLNVSAYSVLGVTIPFAQLVQIVVPARDVDVQLVRHRADSRAIDDRDHRVVRAGDLVDL